jgi:hypothetical protein
MVVMLIIKGFYFINLVFVVSTTWLNLYHDFSSDTDTPRDKTAVLELDVT